LYLFVFTPSRPRIVPIIVADEVLARENMPIWEIDQCDYDDLAKLYVRQLAAGERNGRLGYHPPKE
jgi:hypothetical protein